MTSDNRTTGTTGSPDGPVPRPDPARRGGVDPLPTGPDGLVCSARGCRATAAYDLRWNNPRIHPPGRRKHWLACALHRESLASFLSARDFLREVQDLPATPPGPLPTIV